MCLPVMTVRCLVGGTRLVTLPQQIAADSLQPHHRHITGCSLWWCTNQDDTVYVSLAVLYGGALIRMTQCTYHWLFSMVVH